MIAGKDEIRARPRPDILPSDFFTTEADKTKLNWFLFEFASEVQAAIRRNRKFFRTLIFKGIGPSETAEFCIGFAKGLRGALAAVLDGRKESLDMNATHIANLLPGADDAIVDRLAAIMAAAWERQLSACEVCPTRCVSDHNGRVAMFDMPAYYE